MKFESITASQSGSFHLYLNGEDSLSFIIEGPLGADVFRMMILADTAFIFPGDDGRWSALGADDTVAIREFGISGLSPFLSGVLLFPQFFIRHLNSEDSSGIVRISYRNHVLSLSQGNNDREFQIQDANLRICAKYDRRRDIDGGYYPSQVVITKENADWRLTMRIEKLRPNASIPSQTWHRD